MRYRGFTLVELVVVIVLLGIIGTISSRFIGQTVQLYSDSAIQQQRIAEARFVLERLSREIAGVHPFSLRDPFANNATYQGKCIEYIRIAAVSAYLGSATASAALSVIENPNDVLQTGTVSALSVARRVSVHSQDATDLYSSADNNSVKAITAFSALNNTATFSAAFGSDSTGKRYTVLDKNGPVSWCMFNNQLYRYANYNTNYGTAKTVDWFIAQATAGSAYSSLMAEHVSSSSLFKVTAPTLSHNAALDLSLQLTTDSDGNKLILNRRMQVNYVP
jgi:MSHA biogenesis protein MshO